MPEKHGNTERWGGPGASHEDATKPAKPRKRKLPPTEQSTSPRVSQVSGGGGERDEKHSHVDDVRSSRSHSRDNVSPTSSRAYRQNRSRRDRARDEAEEGQANATPAGDGAAAEEASGGAFINVHTDENLKGYGDVAARVEGEVAEALGRFRDRLTSIEVFISQGSLGGAGAAQDGRCSIEARPRGRKPVAVATEGNDAMQAVRGAITKVSRLLDRRFAKRKDHKGNETIRTGIV
jgi:hypothetical protein